MWGTIFFVPSRVTGSKCVPCSNTNSAANNNDFFLGFIVSFSEHPVIPDPYASFFITLNFLVVLQRCQLIVNNQLIMYQPELPDPNASLVLILIWLLIIMIFLCVFVSFSEHPELPDPYASFLITLNFCVFLPNSYRSCFLYVFFQRISCGKNARCGTDELITASVYPTSEVAHDGRVSP